MTHAARRLPGRPSSPRSGSSGASSTAAPRRRRRSITVELPQRTALLRRIRAYVVACALRRGDAPGHGAPHRRAPRRRARARAAPRPGVTSGAPPGASDGRQRGPPRPIRRVAGGARWGHPPPGPPRPDRPRGRASEHPPTRSFGSALPRRSRPPPPPAELDRASRLLAYLEAHAPEPHVVKHRLALRAGLTLAALERPEALGAGGDRAHRDRGAGHPRHRSRRAAEDRVTTPFGHLVREIAPLRPAQPRRSARHLPVPPPLALPRPDRLRRARRRGLGRAAAGRVRGVARAARLASTPSSASSSPRSGSSSRASSSRRWGTGACVFEITAEGGTVRGHELHLRRELPREVRERG